MSIESVMPSSHLILCPPLLLLPPIPPSIRVLSNESTLCMRCPKYWSFSLSISPSNEHQGLISFRMDWLGLLAAQGTLKSLLQHHSSSINSSMLSFLYGPTLLNYIFLKDFFWCGPFLKSLNLLQYCFWFLFWFFGCEACGILAPQLEMEPACPALEGKVLATEPLGKSQYWLILLIKGTNTLIYTDIKWVFADAIKVRVNIILAWCGPYIQWKLWAFLFL